MATDIGPKIGIQGEAQFRRELGQINTDLKTLGSQMKVVTSEFIGNEHSTEALTKQNDVLEATIVELTQKQQLLEQQLVKTAQAYGSDSKQAQALQQQYNNTTAQINEMTAKVEENNSEISHNDSVLGKLSSGLGDVAKKFGLSSSAASKFSSVLGSSAAVYTAVAGAVVKLVASLNSLAEKQATVIDSVNTMAVKYHATSQEIEAFNYAAKYTDVSTETMLGSLSKLTKNMNAAREGTGAAAEAFKSLGVSVTDGSGQLRNSHTVFMEVIDALRNISNETERDAAAMDIFGKSAVELNGVIEKGSEGLRGYMEEAAKFGVVISDQANQNLQSLQDTIDQTDAIADAAKTNAAAAWAPVAEVLQDVRAGFWLTINDLSTGIAGFNKAGTEMVDVNGKIAESAQNVTGEIKAQSDALDTATGSAKQFKSAYDEIKDAWSRWQSEGSGKVIGHYDSKTGRKSEAFVTNEEYAHYQQMAFAGRSDEYWANRQSGTQQPVNVTLEIDKQTLAQVMVDPIQNETSRRGSRATQ